MGLDGLGEGEVRFTPPCPVAVVGAIDFEQALVSDIADNRDQLAVLGDGVKGIPVDDEVTSLLTFVNVAVDDAQAAKTERKKAVKDIVMISPEVDDIRPALVDFLEDQADEPCMLAGPAAFPAEGPAVNDVTVEDQPVAFGVLEEVVDLFNLTIGGAQVDIR